MLVFILKMVMLMENLWGTFQVFKNFHSLFFFKFMRPVLGKLLDLFLKTNAAINDTFSGL